MAPHRIITDNSGGGGMGLRLSESQGLELGWEFRSHGSRVGSVQFGLVSFIRCLGRRPVKMDGCHDQSIISQSPPFLFFFA